MFGRIRRDEVITVIFLVTKATVEKPPSTSSKYIAAKVQHLDQLKAGAGLFKIIQGRACCCWPEASYQTPSWQRHQLLTLQPNASRNWEHLHIDGVAF